MRSSIGRMSVSKTEDEGSSPYVRAIALVVQWIRTLDYGSSNKRSNRFESTVNGSLAEWLGSGLQNLQHLFDPGRDLKHRVVG